MSIDQRVALRYAQAMLEVGEQVGLDRVNSDMESIAETICASKELRTLLNSPIVKPDAKSRVLVEVFSKQLSKEVMGFVNLLVKKGREGLLFATTEQYRKLVEAKLGIVKAQVKSAISLRAEEQQLITSKLESMTGKKITPSFSVDDAIKGGFIARIGDTLIDASLAHQLELLREQFKHGGAPQMN